MEKIETIMKTKPVLARILIWKQIMYLWYRRIVISQKKRSAGLKKINLILIFMIIKKQGIKRKNYPEWSKQLRAGKHFQ